MLKNNSKITIEELILLQKFSDGKINLMLVFGPLVIAVGILLIVFNNPLVGVIITCIGIGCLVAKAVMAIANKKVRNAFLKDPVKNYEYEFYEEYFTVSINNSWDIGETDKSEINYDEVSAFAEYKGLIFIYLKINAAYVVKADGFTCGAKENLINLLNSKYILNKTK